MYRLSITEPAERDIREAARYIAMELQNLTAADRLLDDLTEAIYSLNEMPLRYALVSDEVLAIRGFRFFPIHNYLVFYTVREERKTVVIERFLYGRRNWSDILKDEPKMAYAPHSGKNDDEC